MSQLGNDSVSLEGVMKYFFFIFTLIILPRIVKGQPMQAVTMPQETAEAGDSPKLSAPPVQESPKIVMPQIVQPKIVQSKMVQKESPKDEQVVGVYYLKNMFGHLHQTTNANSVSLTTLACGHPIKVLKTEKVQGETWFMAEVGAHKGYLQEDHLSQKRPECFQGTYPNFFNNLNLDLAQMYYWGRLYDQFIELEVKVQ